MKKLLIVLLFEASSIIGYTYNFNNQSAVKVKVTLATIAGPDYPIEINPKEVGTINTGGWCRRALKIDALGIHPEFGPLVSFSENFDCFPITGINCCLDRTYTIYADIPYAIYSKTGHTGILAPQLTVRGEK